MRFWRRTGQAESDRSLGRLAVEWRPAKQPWSGHQHAGNRYGGKRDPSHRL